MKFDLKKEINYNEILLDTECNIQYSNELFELLQNQLQSAPCLIIDQRKAVEFDLTYIQILYKLHIKATKENKRIELKNAGQSFLNLLNNAGISPASFNYWRKNVQNNYDS